MEGRKICFSAFLLSTLYTVCSSYCPSSQLSYEDCSRYYNEVEAALLKDQYNKYQLHEEFFPSSHSAPLYGYALYTNLSDEYGHPYDICIPWSSSVLLTYIDPYTLNNLQLRLMEFLFITTGVQYLTSLDKPNADCDITLGPSQNSSDHEMEFNTYRNTIAQLTLTLNLSMPYKAAKVILVDLTSWVSIAMYTWLALNFPYGKTSQSKTKMYN